MLLMSRKSILTKTLIFIPIVFFLGASMANKINIGLRHILPIYPFLFLLAGYAGSQIGKVKPKVLRNVLATILTLLVILSASRTLVSGPEHLAYFNELVGGAEQGAKLVAGSNLNWGQDNRRLAEFVLEKRIPFITIASEAENADIYDYYKIHWKRLKTSDLINPVAGVYALGSEYYIAQQKDSLSWFYGKRPLYRVGKTFYVFEVPEKQAATKL
jgi:hypothetical protein